MLLAAAHFSAFGYVSNKKDTVFMMHKTVSFLYLLCRKLTIIQFRVHAAFFKQFIMAAGFYYRPVIHH